MALIVMRQDLVRLGRFVLDCPGKRVKGGDAMAKGQMRSNKEARKPKADKKAKGAAGGGEQSKSGSGNKPFGDGKKKG